jgi:hypothetical protein
MHTHPENPAPGAEFQAVPRRNFANPCAGKRIAGAWILSRKKFPLREGRLQRSDNLIHIVIHNFCEEPEKRHIG